MSDDARSGADPRTRGDASGPLGLEPWLLEILVCPACRAALRVDEAASTLVCTGCRLVYPVRDGIPVLLVDEALRPSG